MPALQGGRDLFSRLFLLKDEEISTTPLITRRHFLESSAAIAPLGMRQLPHHMPKMAPEPMLIDPGRLTPYIDPLPLIQVAKSVGMAPNPSDPSVKLPLYRIPLHEIQRKVHRDIAATRFWAFGSSVPGPTIETRSGEGLLVDWPNELPAKHFLPIDHTIMGAEAGKPDSRSVVHLHGGKAPPTSDGYPENWYAPGKSATYHYPNDQDACLLWYHDHAMGINRLNMYAGMFGLFIVRDKVEDSFGLPKGNYEIPLVIFDRFFREDGQLYYPVSQRPESPWVPEYFGNAILVNGKLLPYLDVEPRPYRIRLLNASNARFYFLTLSNGKPFSQIGTDQGFLSAPVEVAMLTIAPAERADLIVDFAAHEGEQIVLQNQTSPVMQFRVGKGTKGAVLAIPKTLRPVPKMLEASAVKTRELSLAQYDNAVGETDIHLLDGKRWHEPVTENPVGDTTEIWSFVNVTDDVHPIHLHLVRFQILDRRVFDVTEYLVSKKIRYVGDVFPPEPNEAGWKDTVRATPGAVTRIVVRFEGYTGRYVWHCHILEHEDNEMMRPYDILPAGKTAT